MSTHRSPVAPLETVRNLRFARDVLDRRQRLGDWLADLSDRVTSGTFGYDRVHADPNVVVVVGVDDHGPVAVWNGQGHASDLLAAADALTSIAKGVMAGGTDMANLIADARTDWQAADAARRADADARRAWLAAHPWCCEFCNTRFATQQHAEAHETGCAANPRARPHRRRRRRLS